MVENILRNSGLTDEDAENIGHQIKAEISKRFIK